MFPEALAAQCALRSRSSASRDPRGRVGCVAQVMTGHYEGAEGDVWMQSLQLSVVTHLTPLI